MARDLAESGMQSGAVAFEAVSKRYRHAGRPSVDHVSFDVEPGSFVVLLGPSGCGKTTLLKMVNRLIEPTAGRITIDGVDIESMAAPKLRRGIGYVIQQTGLFPHMRVEQNVAVVPALLRWPRERIAERTHELLELVGLDPASYRRRFPAQLSGGEQQRVGLARALAAEPSILLMDEPFGALDAITRTRLQDEMRRIHRTLRPTIIFVTHDIDEAVRLAERIVVMRDGRLIQHGRPIDIVLNPADEFVRNLVGADDVVRRLGLISAGDVAESHVGPEPLLAVDASASLREALALLLESSERRIGVRDETGSLTGSLDLDTVARASARGASAILAVTT